MASLAGGKRSPSIEATRKRARSAESLPSGYALFTDNAPVAATAEIETQRLGTRAMYAEQLPYLYLEYHTPVHGDRPFAIVHIDHTLLDIELVCGKAKQRRPWEQPLSSPASSLAFRASMHPKKEAIHRKEPLAGQPKTTRRSFVVFRTKRSTGEMWSSWTALAPNFEGFKAACCWVSPPFRKHTHFLWGRAEDRARVWEGFQINS